MIIPCLTCHKDPDKCYCCVFCGAEDCEYGSCERCLSSMFHTTKDGLCKVCMICTLCKHPTMGWDSYDEAWACSFCLSELDKRNEREMIHHPYHTVRKDVPIYLKENIWKSAFGSAKEGPCFSCRVILKPPRFCCVQKVDDFLPICGSCSKSMGSMTYEQFISRGAPNIPYKIRDSTSTPATSIVCAPSTAKL